MGEPMGACIGRRKVFVEGNFIKSVNLKFFISYDNKCVGFNKLKLTSRQTMPFFFFCFGPCGVRSENG